MSTPELDELCGRMIEVYSDDGLSMRLRFDSDLKPETMAPIVAAMRNVSSYAVMAVHEALTEKNVFIRKDGAHWPLRGFMMHVTAEKVCGINGPELYFPKWKLASFAWDNGTITINVDGNVATLTNCGNYAKLMLTRLAPDMDENNAKTVGLYAYDKWAFGFRVEDGDSDRLQMRVRLDQTEINWEIADADWKVSD